MRGFESCYPCIKFFTNSNNLNKNILIFLNINFSFSTKNKTKSLTKFKFKNNKKTISVLKKKGKTHLYLLKNFKKKNIRLSPIILQFSLKSNFRNFLIDKSKNFKNFIKQKNSKSSLKQKNSFFFFKTKIKSEKDFLKKTVKAKYLSQGLNVAHFFFTKHNYLVISNFFFFFCYHSLPILKIFSTLKIISTLLFFLKTTYLLKFYLFFLNMKIIFSVKNLF